MHEICMSEKQNKNKNKTKKKKKKKQQQKNKQTDKQKKKERVNKHFDLLYHIQRSRPVIGHHILHAIEQTRQSLGKVHLLIRSYIEILC